MESLVRKERDLLDALSAMGSVIVAYSGGADSAYLAWAAQRALGDRALALTADSASLPESHKRDAEEFARTWGIRHEYVATREFENPDYVKNDGNRCFHCKDELFTRLDAIASERGIAHVVYGVNVDDLGDYRPGQRAAKLHQVRAPLVDAGMTKAEIRELSRRAGLVTWDRPGFGVPELANSLWDSRDHPEREDGRGRRGGDSRAGFPAVPSPLSTASWCGSRLLRKNWLERFRPEVCSRVYGAFSSRSGFTTSRSIWKATGRVR